MILVFGTVCLDRIIRVSKMPQPGDYVEALSQHLALGGEAANTTLALIKLGAKVRLIGNPRGDDDKGALLARHLADAGLPDMQIQQGIETPFCDIYVMPNGERAMVGHGFSHLEYMSPPDLDFSDVSWFTGDPNMQTIAPRVVEQAKRHNVKTYLMDFVRPETFECVEGCDVWQSSTDWVGTRGDTDANLRWAEDWTRRFGCCTILTDGPHPFVACRSGQPAVAIPTFAVKAVDTTGAGDVFRAGTLYGLDQGWTWERCLVTGAAAAALTSRSLGASSGHPTLDEITRFIAAKPPSPAM